MKRIASLTSLCLALFSGAIGESFAQEKHHNALSLQSFTGILNTPNAHVTDEGSAYFLFSNQEENKWRNRTSRQENYMFSVGFFNFAEVGGRLVQAPRVANDLSGNFKFTTAPFFKDIPYLPAIAFGMQDVGGGVKLLQTKYVVASEEVWRLRLSLGYGTGPNRMDGIFGGAEFKAHDWVYLLGEYDTEETNVGARIVTPPFWKVPVSFTATAKTSIDHKPGNFDIAFGFTFPLDFKVRNEEKGKRIEVEGKRIEVEGKRTEDSTTASTLDPRTSLSEPRSSNLEPRTSNLDPRSSNLAPLPALRDRLLAAGFLNVRVGEGPSRTLVVEYENSIFNHNEMDAMGVVAGMAAEAARDRFDSVRLVVKKKDIRMVQVTLPVAQFRSFLENESALPDLKSKVVTSTEFADDGAISFVGGEENSNFLATSLVLWPGLTTFVGTEYGAFDYLLSLKPDLYVNLWKGGLLNARWDIPLSWSGNLDNGGVYRNSRKPAQLERLMLFQGVKLLPGLMANLGAGLLRHDMPGTLNEVVWQPGDGSHRVRLTQVWGRDDKRHTTTDAYLAAYRYYYSPLDLSLEGTAGRFMFEDKGAMAELKRFFGDTAVSLYYKNTTTADDKRWQAVGIHFAFPLTPSRDMKHYYKMQVRGTEEWSYSQETTLKNKNRDDGRGALNYLPSVPLAVAPLFTGSLHNQYLDRDRLNDAYIRSHLFRLREAWLSKGKEI